MLVILTFFLITILGYLLVSVWKDDFEFLERIFLGFGLGIGLVTLWMFFLGAVKVSFSKQLIVFPLIGIVGLLLVVLKSKGKIEFPSEIQIFKKLNFFQVAFLLLMAGLVGWSLSQTLAWPPFEWDALALYDFRAQRFLETGSLAEDILTKPTELVTYTYSYPLFTSLAHTLVYLLNGGNPKFIYTLIYLSLLVCFYFCLRRRTSKTLSLGITAVLATTPAFVHHSTIAYTNLPYTFYFVLGTLYFWEWVVYKKDGYFWLSSLFLGLSTWVRSQEPFWLANLFILGIYCLKNKKLKLFIPYTIIFFTIRQSWSIYRHSVYLQVKGLQEVPLKVAFDFGKIFTILPFVVKNVLLDWRILILVFLAIFLWGGKKQLRKNWPIIALLLVYLFMVYAGTYYLSVNFTWWYKIGGSAARMTMFFFPLILYATTAVFFTLPKTKKNSQDNFNLRSCFKN